MSVLLSRLKTGGQLAGLSLAPGKAAVVTEESPVHWLPRIQKLDCGNNICFFCRPFPDKPTPAQWLALLDRLAEVHARHTLNLVAIDTLAPSFPAGARTAPRSCSTSSCPCAA